MNAVTSQTTTSRRRLWLALAGVAVVIVAAAAVGLYLFFRDSAPAAVDLAATRDAVTGDSAVEPVDAAGGIDGTWSVDTSVGEFTVEDDTTATFVGFRVDEELSSIGATTAVGRTPEVSGTVQIADGTVTSAEITADLTRIVSNERRRDGVIQQTLNTASNPAAVFALTAPIQLADRAAEGELVEATAAGQLTVNGVTNDVEVALAAQVVEGRILITGSTDVVFADYGVPTPSAPIVLAVDDHGIMELQLWLSR